MSKREEGPFGSRDGTRLWWAATLPDGPAQAAVAMLHGGAGDHHGRYQRMVQALVDQGIAVFGCDYRGHGRAEGRRGDLLAWPLFLDDFDAFFEKAQGQAQALGQKLQLFGHSQGGLLAASALLERPRPVQAVALSSPFFELGFQPPPAKLFAARVLRRVAPWLALGNELTLEQLSTDAAWQKESEADPLRFGVITSRFFWEVREAQERVLARAAEFTHPLLVAVGEQDTIASPQAAARWFNATRSADRTMKTYPGFRHEIWAETGKERVWNDIAQWILDHR